MIRSDVQALVVVLISATLAGASWCCESDADPTIPPTIEPSADTIPVFDSTYTSLRVPDSVKIGDTFSVVFKFRSLEEAAARAYVILGHPGVEQNAYPLSIVEPYRDSLRGGNRSERQVRLVKGLIDSIAYQVVAYRRDMVDGELLRTFLQVGMSMDSVLFEGEMIHIKTRYPGISRLAHLETIGSFIVY